MSEVTNKHRIQVNATVRDSSGGKAYAFALDANASVSEIKLKIKQAKLVPETHMTFLGDFGSVGTPLSVDVTQHIVWTSVNSGIRYQNSLTSGDSYYAYIYAVDPFENAVVVASGANPIQMTTETITITFSTLQPSEYAQQRTRVEPTVDTVTGFFDFYNGKTDKLYAHLSIDPKESVVSDVSVVAFSSKQSLSAVESFDKAKRTVVFDDQTMISGAPTTTPTTPIDRFYNGVSDATGTLFTDHFATNGYGDVFYVYTVMRDVGFEKWIVQEFQVLAGKLPVIEGSTAEIVEIP